MNRVIEVRGDDPSVRAEAISFWRAWLLPGVIAVFFYIYLSLLPFLLVFVGLCMSETRQLRILLLVAVLSSQPLPMARI